MPLRLFEVPMDSDSIFSNVSCLPEKSATLIPALRTITLLHNLHNSEGSELHIIIEVPFLVAFKIRS